MVSVFHYYWLRQLSQMNTMTRCEEFGQKLTRLMTMTAMEEIQQMTKVTSEGDGNRNLEKGFR